MKEFKGTPGPWKANGDSKKGNTWFNVIGTIPGCKFKIAKCPYIRVDDAYEYNILEMAEAEANARIIAAAPDLLQACLDSLDAQTMKEIEKSKKACRLAINKALGG